MINKKIYFMFISSFNSFCFVVRIAWAVGCEILKQMNV